MWAHLLLDLATLDHLVGDKPNFRATRIVPDLQFAPESNYGTDRPDTDTQCSATRNSVGRRSREELSMSTYPFYASVEQRDDPHLFGKPVIIAWHGHRSIGDGKLAVQLFAREAGVSRNAKSFTPGEDGYRWRPIR